MDVEIVDFIGDVHKFPDFLVRRLNRSAEFVEFVAAIVDQRVAKGKRIGLVVDTEIGATLPGCADMEVVVIKNCRS
jgi:hypothetical protein